MFGRPRKVIHRYETWVLVDCGGCGLPVAFLPSQYVNTCGWCRTVVCRGLE